MSLIVPNRDDWFQSGDTFFRPDWAAIRGWMRAFVTDDGMNDAWQQFTRHWLERLRARLGGGYVVAESENFHFLSEVVPNSTANILSFLETARRRIYKVLGDVAPPKAYGKHVILRFTETDDYYLYISHFHRAGEYAGSGGMFLDDGYMHIAYPKSWSETEGRQTLVHELTHNLLAHLPLPPWVNEALAMAFETDISGSRTEPLSRDLAARHRNYWNATTIQAFWRGESFYDIEGQELAYSLSRILLNLIYTEVRPPEEEFRRFVRRADWSDAGAIAAREHLNIDLSDLAACFLGPGDWLPDPKTWHTQETSG